MGRWQTSQTRQQVGEARSASRAPAEKVRIRIQSIDQGMFIQHRAPGNPVLLVVHGGPGLPDYFLTSRYPVGLDELFTVVWWEQRGTGLSYQRTIPPQTMTIEQFIADTVAVTDHLRERFGADRIYLLGHSWGSFLGIQAAARAPERYHAYIGMAQVVHQLRSERLAWEYMLAEFRARGDNRMVRRLEAAPVTMEAGTPAAYLRLRDAGMHRLGVGTTHDMRSVVTGIFLTSLRFPEYTLRDKLALWQGRAFSRSFGIWDRMIHTDLMQRVPQLEVPVYLFEGVHDRTCSYDLARDYFAALDAPRKGFYTFEQSAHSPMLEEPERAYRILRDDVLAGTTTLADQLSTSPAHPDHGP